ncbi:hypothetical protein NEILACOT_04502 [Neisseria lactamica ATCC 23970]|uniref:Uncharacterized protein n=1 Tax=Neisseria lactamica ATCC 23970 TaxID=546265 RepID=D0WAD3_NEILA|nr:hypothetical protein NEILACOT_04502 [Neisseria lactamica ATCC 23970]
MPNFTQMPSEQVSDGILFGSSKDDVAPVAFKIADVMFCRRKISGTTATMPPAPLQTACRPRAAHIIPPCPRKRA